MSVFATDPRHVLSSAAKPGLLHRLLRRRPAQPETAPEDARARRQFVQDMLSRNSGAFSSDLDVQGMMTLFPGRF